MCARIGRGYRDKSSYLCISVAPKIRITFFWTRRRNYLPLDMDLDDPLLGLECLIYMISGVCEKLMVDAKGIDVDLSTYKGKALLIVNAPYNDLSGLTNSNYTELAKLYEKYINQAEYPIFDKVLFPPLPFVQPIVVKYEIHVVAGAILQRWKLFIHWHSAGYIGLLKQQTSEYSSTLSLVDDILEQTGMCKLYVTFLWCSFIDQDGQVHIYDLLTGQWTASFQAAAGDVSTTKKLLEGVQAMEQISNGSETELLYSVSDPLLIRDGSETEYHISVSGLLLIKDGSETEYNNSVFDPLLIRDGSETECNYNCTI
ncbi:hypothetical protein Syun_012422 [Stephania yunnanensis]|uniref:Uncharacterized protein n=1 Tax=Stephania yunnanensis TaxID=152371 RepID=A0AAP0JZI2_9MAGN